MSYKITAAEKHWKKTLELNRLNC